MASSSVALASRGASGSASGSKLAKTKPVPGLRGQGGEADAALAEAGPVVHVGGAEQAAVEAVGPPVVGAAEGAGAPPLLAGLIQPRPAGLLGRGGDAHAPVLAHRRHDVDLAAAVPDHDHPLAAGQGGGEVVAGLGDLVGPAHAQPAPLEHRGQLELMEVGPGVSPRRQRHRPVHSSRRRLKLRQRYRTNKRQAHSTPLVAARSQARRSSASPPARRRHARPTLQAPRRAGLGFHPYACLPGAELCPWLCRPWCAGPVGRSVRQVDVHC